jgi:hypothetical protein
MDANGDRRTYQIGHDEKATSVMVYTEMQLILGDVITKKAIKVSTWLRTPSLPQFIRLYDSSVLYFSVDGGQKPQPYRELLLPSPEVIVFHIKPPAQDPLDYDPNEPNRKMEPVSATIGHFRFDGYIRMSSQTNLERFLDVSKEDFISLYDVRVFQPNNPTRGAFNIPYILVRSKKTMFSPSTRDN